MRFGAVAAFGCAVALGCGGLIAPAPSDAGTDVVAPSDDASALPAEASVPKAPKMAPRRLVFHNQEDVAGLLSGVAVLRRPSDESDVVDYVYYWGKSATEKLSTTPLATFVKTNRDPVLIVDKAMPLPAGATHILGYSRNETGETGPAAASVAFVAPSWRDVSGGAPGNTARLPSVAFDSRNQRLLIVGTPAFEPGSGARYISCDAQGKGCTTKAIGATTNTGAASGSLVLDAANDALMFTLNLPAGALTVPTTVRCKLDGTSCTTKGLTAPADHTSVRWPILDSKHSAFLAPVVPSNPGFDSSFILRCKGDATACLPGFDAIESYTVMRPVLDDANDKLLVAAGVPQGDGFDLLVCARDGSTCTTKPVAASLGHGADAFGADMLAFVASEDDRVSVITVGLALYRIALDGSTSVRQPLGPSLSFPSLVVDDEGRHFAVTGLGNGHVPELRRCPLDGVGCTARSLAAGRSPDGFWNMTSTYDPELRMLYMVYENIETTSSHTGLVTFGL